MSVVKPDEKSLNVEGLKTRRHRVAVVGCGALARAAHLPHAQRNPRIDLAVTCDIDEDTTKMCCEKFGAERYETDGLKVVNAPDVDMIILATHRFLIHIEDKGENPCNVESAVAVNRLAVKFLESARSGLPVAVGPEDWHLPSL